LIFIVFSCFLSYSQTNDSVFSKKQPKHNSIKSSSSFSKTLPNFNYKLKTNPLFSVYNRDTEWNDMYFVSKDTAFYVKSSNLNYNLYIKKDSFNPYGASNPGEGIIIGTIGILFDSFFNKP